MTIASGVNKSVRMKVEGSGWGVAPGTSGAQVMRRSSFVPNLKKQTYESDEIAAHLQRQDMRHGVRSVEITHAGPLSAGTWKDYLAAVTRRAFAAVTPGTAGITISIAGTANGIVSYTVARSTGSWLTDGYKMGMVGRLATGTFNAANSNKNLAITAVTSGNITVIPVNSVALVAEGPIAAGVFTAPGKVTFVPSTGHTDSSFAFEDWHGDISQSELYLGNKLNQMDITIPPAGNATISSQFIGKDVTTGTAAYFQSPTAETTTGIEVAANGLLIVQGSGIALATAFSISIKGGMTAEPVVGSNVYPDIAEGRILVDGSATVLFDSATQRDFFLNETEVSLIAVVASSPSGTADFHSFCIPRAKFNSADKDDGEKNLTRQITFAGLYNSAGGSGIQSEQTTLQVQDSGA
jgi:hypothetical protein